MCDCAEELDRQRQALPGRSSSHQKGSSIHSRDESSRWDWLLAWFWGGDGKSWFPILGGATCLLAFLAFLYKSLDKMKVLVWKTDGTGTNSCTTLGKKQKNKPEKFIPCKCEDKK